MKRKKEERKRERKKERKKERKIGTALRFTRVFLGVAESLLVSYCFAVWVLCLSIFCITSFGDCTYPQHQETILYPKIISHEQTTDKCQ